MVNQLVLFINLIGVLLFGSFLGNDISITQNIPANMDPGTEVRVTVTVNKGDLKGFAKLQLDLPEGMSVTSIETSGASFTFADQKAKFIWMALPGTPTFKVTYTLAAGANASGNLPILGRFSYIEDNERKTFDLPTTTVNLGNASAAPIITETPETPATNDVVEEIAEAVTPPSGMPVITPSTTVATPTVTTPTVTGPTITTPTVTTPVVTPPVVNSNPVTSTTPPATATTTTTPPVANNMGTSSGPQGVGNVTCSRKVTPVTADEMLVEVTIKKGNIRGFGKLQEVIPFGFTAVEKSSEDAIFTTQDQIVKFVWLNLPAKNEVTIVYKLRTNNSTTTGEHVINGDFGYLLNDETQKCTTGTTKFLVGPDALAGIDPEIAGNIPTPTPIVTPPAAITPVIPATPPVTVSPDPIVVPDPVVPEPVIVPEPVVIPTPVVPDPVVVPTPVVPDPVAQDPIEPVKTTPVVPPVRPEVVQEPVVAERSTIPVPERGITFKVQISATHKEVSKTYFPKLHKYNGLYSMERHQGWIKYVTGSFMTYKEAKQQRNNYVQSGHNFPGPFVTAYNNGERITVQEALVLANQKWNA